MSQSISAKSENLPRHFIEEHDLSADEFRQILKSAIELKDEWKAGQVRQTLQNRTMAMIFEKASTRTRCSFEAGMNQLGGHAINLSPNDSQLGRGEPITDTSRVLSEMVDVAMLRTRSHNTIEEFASVATIPVINGLSDLLHPCQMLADMQTFFELRGDIQGATVAWVGAGNNVCNSFINTAKLLNFNLAIACPDAFQPATTLLTDAADNVTLTNDPAVACEKADMIVTDVWTSMGEEAENEQRTESLAAFQVNTALLQLASDDVLFLHCLPAHRGEEVTAEVIDGPHSAVWQEAGNRLHAQKALLEFLLAANSPRV